MQESAGASSQSICSVIVDYVIDHVVNHVYNVGDKLPPERDLAQTLNVSRAAVREAIKVLNYLGFVDSTQGSGNYITDTCDKTTANIMLVMYRRGDVDMEGFTAFRQMLELEAFYLALSNATQRQKSELQQIVDLLDVTTDTTLMFRLDNRFHALLAEASHNRLIIINFNALSNAILEYMFDTYNKNVKKKPNGFAQLQQYHHAMVDALIKNDWESGRKAIYDHFFWASR